MGQFNADQIRAIKYLISQEKFVDALAGFVVTRDAASNTATVRHVNADQPIPMKVAGNVYCRAGDKVLTKLFDTQWWVIGADTSLALGEANATMIGSSQNTSVATYSDVTGWPNQVFEKAQNSTYVRLGLNASFWPSVSLPCAVRWAVRVTALDPVAWTATDVNLGFQYGAVLNQHQPFYSFAWVINMPAGRYSLLPRWRRYAGSGQANIDVGDWFHLEANEAVRWWG
jgi:hypothetical protein